MHDARSKYLHRASWILYHVEENHRERENHE